MGNGTASYVPVTGACCDVTSIATFDGNVTNDGPDIRACTITFNENSPATGEVSISIEDGRTISTDLYELEQRADIILGE